MGSASQRLRQPNRPAARSLRVDSHHQLQKENHPWRVVSFLRFCGRESEGGQKKPRWGFFPPLGSASQRLRQPNRPAARSLRADSHHQLQKENHPWRVVFFLSFTEGSRRAGCKSPGGAFVRPWGAQASGNAAHRASSPKIARRLPSPAELLRSKILRLAMLAQDDR